MRSIPSIALAVVLANVAIPADARQSTLVIPRVAEPPTLQRYVDGNALRPGVEVTGLRQREPGDGVPVSSETSVYLSYDVNHLYVVFVCKDDPARIRANLARREAITEDDAVGIVLDTYHDGRRAYLFLTNPFGIQRDGIWSDGQDDDYSYDTLWHSEGRLTADGYVVLMAIPFKSLRFSNQPRQTWGIAVARIITRANETSFWPYVTHRIASLGQQLATLEGIEGVSPGRNLQAIPYASYAGARFQDERGVSVSDATGRAGVDGKAVIKDTLTLDVTVNPDFSQVESDEPQVTINQRFEVFFPEKRPFFIENASYFDTPEQLFFSRRIADPGVGTRLTGKTRGWSFGGLLVNDEQPGRIVAEEDPRRGATAGIGVLRVQREFARQSYVGGILTERRFEGAGNRVFGADGRWRLDDNWALTAQWVGSRTRAIAGGGEATGTLAGAEISRDGRAFDYSSRYKEASPEFRAELGFIPRVDLREMEHEAGYSWYPRQSRVLRVSADVESAVLWDYGGELQDWSVEPGMEVELPGQTELDVRHWNEFERFEGVEFRHRSTMLRASSAWLSWLGVEAEYMWGTGINYYPAPGIAPFLGRSESAEVGATLRPSARLRLDQRYLFSRLATRDGGGSGDGREAGDIFNNHILRTWVNYQFSRELTGRLIVDYEAVLPNGALVSLDREKRVRFDALATFMVNPWTAVYVGYTDAYENWRRPVDRPIVRGGGPTTSVGRQVFVKVSYLFRY
jgi:hypothetical protein